ncbi:hypothetical protein F0562_033834 [Nyssa sinensis]|uniref:Retrovirus-related Pol polyprotein from transposon TNT 1-94-like beta-barrel domain-containing protein n=1 Tax=Nyssa sinensis TaxID=561372 RepID=A0A5J5AIS7_9ASTE|nr:hypothetical protein F0562_033834 [Nyssa sinensis]
MRKNFYAWKREQKEENNNQKKNEEKNTIGTFEGDEVVVLSCGEEECLHVGNEIDWVVDTGASYHAIYNKEFFTSYKAGDFGTVKMGNTSHSKIVGIGDVRIRTSVGCTMTLGDVGNEIEWVVDTGASYHATYNKEFFTSYKAGDFGTVKMGNTSHSKIVGTGDVRIRTSVGWTMTLRDVRHVPDLRLNLISGIALDQEGYVNYFGNGIWKLTKGSLFVASGKACCALYKTNLKVCRDGLNSIEDVDIVVDLTRNTPPLEHAEDGGEVQEEPVRDKTPLMTNDMPESDARVR